MHKTERLASLVASALECAVSERGRFLNDVCGDDVALREEAESFLRFEERARDFLEKPAFEITGNGILEQTPATSEPASEETETVDWPEQIGPEAMEARPSDVREDVLSTEVSDEIIPEIKVSPLEVAQDLMVEKAPAAPESPGEETVAIDLIEKIEPETTEGRASARLGRAEAHLSSVTPHDIPSPDVPREIKPEVQIPPVFERKDRVAVPQFGLYTAARILAVALLLVAIIVLVGARRKVEKLWRERDIAQADRARAESITNFLQRTFSFSKQNLTSVWPVSQRKEMTVNEMLDQVAPRIEKEFGDRPDLRAEMLRMVGSAYAAQGRYDAAEKNLRAAFGAQIRLHGEESADTASTMVELGILSARQLKFNEARRLLEKAIGFYRKQRLAKSPQYSPARLALALGYLGDLQFHHGDTKAGLSHMSEALQISSSANLQGNERGVLTFNKGKLGTAFVVLGETEKGEALLQEAIGEYRSASAEPRWEVGEFDMMLGLAALNKNQPDEAEKYLVESERILRRTLGDTNIYLVTNLNYQAAAFALKGDFETAEEKARKCVAMSKAASPKNKLPWAEPLRTLGNILTLAGQTKEGEDYYRQALRICEQQATRNYNVIVPLKIQLCHLLLAQKRLTEAENVAFEAQNEARQHFDEQDPVRKAATSNLVQIYQKQGKDDVAQTVR